MISFPDLTTEIALSMILLASRLLWNYIQFPLKSFPGPNLTSFTDLWRMLAVCNGRFHVTHNELHRRYGPAVHMGPNILSLSGPGLIRFLYKTKDPWLKVNVHVKDKGASP